MPPDNLIPMPCDLVVWALGIRAPTTRSGFERCCFSEPIHLNPAVLYFFQHIYFFVPRVLSLSRENMEFPVQEGKPTAAQ